MVLAGNAVAGVEITFEIDVVNRHDSQQFAQTFEIDVDRLSTSLTTLGLAMAITYPTIVATMGQSSSLPCDPANTITVDLTVDNQLKGSCNTIITISGVTGSRTASTSALTMTGDITTADWTQDSGQLIIDLSGGGATDVPADSSINFAFELANQADNEYMGTQVTFTASFNPSALIANQFQSTASSTSMTGLYIEPAEMMAFVSQSAYYPCESNGITIALYLNVPAFTDCVHNITIAGLTGSTTSSP
eukprot:148633-Rhodomonas_salina.1